MGKSDTVQAQMAAVQAAQQQALTDALGKAYDQGVADQKASEPVVDPSQAVVFTQSDIDSAVAKAQGVDAQALADAQAKAKSDLDALQAKLDGVSAKELKEEGTVNSLKTAVSNLQSSIAAVQALMVDPTPVDVTPGQDATTPAVSTSAGSSASSSATTTPAGTSSASGNQNPAQPDPTAPQAQK